MYSIGKGSKSLRSERCILWLWKSRQNVLVLWFIHILQTVQFQRLKRLKSFKLSMWKGNLVPIEGIFKGVAFLSKTVWKNDRGLDLRVEPPRRKISWSCTPGILSAMRGTGSVPYGFKAAGYLHNTLILRPFQLHILAEERRCFVVLIESPSGKCVAWPDSKSSCFTCTSVKLC